MLSDIILLRGDIYTASVVCDREKEAKQEREAKAKADPSNDQGILIVPRHEDEESKPWKGQASALYLSEADCGRIQAIAQSLENGRLVAKFNPSSQDEGVDLKKYFEGVTIFGDFDAKTSIMGRIEIEATKVATTQDKADEIKQQLDALSYFSFFKSLSPILLGIGIGIRLSRTHYDVKREEAEQTRRGQT